MPVLLDSAELLGSLAAAVQSSAVAPAFEAVSTAMPSLRTLGQLALGSAQVLLAQAAVDPFQSCSSPQLSCHNTTVVQNLCCFNAPGGQLLQTQFWDASPATGPSNSWTIHGLWPDHCDGTFDANCDSTRAYSNITAILKAFGATDTLSYMQTYWKDVSGNDESFWDHEWSKHGTCVSTLNPECYADHKPTEEVVDFFDRTVSLFKTLPSYDWLSAAGIVPSSTKTYTTAQIQSALSAKRSGVQVTLGCSSGALNEIWYHFDVRGSLQVGDFVPAAPDGTKSTCPSTGIKYLPKSGSSPVTTTTAGTTTSGSTPTSTSTPGTPFSGKGYLNVAVGGSTTGCIISSGAWYASGTCATITATQSGSSFTLTSSKGNCGIVSGALTCGSSVSTATAFTAVDGNLAAGGNSAFSADSTASGSTQVTVYSGSDHSQQLTLTWQSL